MRPLVIVIFSLILFSSCGSDQPSAIKDEKKSEPEDVLVKTEGKGAMNLLTERPPNLETPLKYFLKDFTPNDVFFVRWHLSGIPSTVNKDTFHLYVGGHVKKELALTLDDLKTKFKPYSIIAVAECAGNSRSFFDPRVPGGQWKNGAMGNAKWTGVKLKDILEMAGIKAGAKDISFNGLDAPPLPSVPDFVKSLKVDHAMDGEVMIAYSMNDEPLPMLNGFPLKLVVPGWYATYWVGMLSEIKVYADTFKGFWMDKAYLIPKNVKNGNEKPDSLGKDLVPINKLDVRSIFVSPEPGENLKSGTEVEIQGLAMDDGSGISKVELSVDSGAHWLAATLDPVIGKYSWRRWRFSWKPIAAGNYKLKVKATNAPGDTQPDHQWNRSGYMRNEIETLELHVQ